MRTFTLLAVLALPCLSHAQAKKTGAAAYDDYPKEERERLVKDWQDEIKAVERRIKTAPDRARQELAKRTNLRVRVGGRLIPANVKRAQDILKAAEAGKKLLAKLKRNVPPFLKKAEDPDKGVGSLNINNLKAGDKGRLDGADAKVMQVLDDDRMLVGIEDAQNGDGKYRLWVMVKCPTKGIVDDKFWKGSQWKEMTGFAVWTVSGTTRYKTASGATRTVFVLEPAKKK